MLLINFTLFTIINQTYQIRHSHSGQHTDLPYRRVSLYLGQWCPLIETCFIYHLILGLGFFHLLAYFKGPIFPPLQCLVKVLISMRWYIYGFKYPPSQYTPVRHDIKTSYRLWLMLWLIDVVLHLSHGLIVSVSSILMNFSSDWLVSQANHM